jgi:hypothetical protein
MSSATPRPTFRLALAVWVSFALGATTMTINARTTSAGEAAR